jgi:hypothetical protein
MMVVSGPTLVLWTVMYAFATPLMLLWAFVFGFSFLRLGSPNSHAFLAQLNPIRKVAFFSSIGISCIRVVCHLSDAPNINQSINLSTNQSTYQPTNAMRCALSCV